MNYYTRSLAALRNFRNTMRFIGESIGKRVGPLVVALDVGGVVEAVIYALRVLFVKGGG